MTDQEKQCLINAFLHSHKVLLQSLEGLTEEQFRAKPETGGWCVADVIEHLTILEDRVLTVVIPRCLSNARTEDVDTSKDTMLPEAIRARNERINGPPPVHPQGHDLTREQALSDFADLRVKNINYVCSTSDDLRHHRANHPIFGPLDGYQWLLVLSAHTERHVKQIEEVLSGFVIN